MLLNFGILKMRFHRPTRSDQYSTGPLDVSFTASPIKAIGIANRINSRLLDMMSHNRFIIINSERLTHKCTLIAH
jgi:hypothetical protein